MYVRSEEGQSATLFTSSLIADGWGGVNTGVFMMHLDRIRAHSNVYWGEVMRIVNEGGRAAARFNSSTSLITPEDTLIQRERKGMPYYEVLYYFARTRVPPQTSRDSLQGHHVDNVL